MKERIKLIRKEHNQTQQQFADTLGVSKNNIVNYEVGRRGPSAAVVQLICKEYNVNETWLLTGEGEMHASQTKEQEIAAITAKLFQEDDSFKMALMKLIMQMDEKQMKMLKDMAIKLAEAAKEQ